MKEDSLYIDRFLSGDITGFEMLVRKYQDRALNIIYSLIGRDGESEDIMQEAFLRVYHNLKGFNRNSSFSTWFYRIIVNLTYDFLRKRRNAIQDENSIKESVSGQADPRKALSLKEEGLIVSKALEDVPVKFRAALVLKDIEGLSYKDISRILCCSIGTVESRIYRARQCLKKVLGRLGGEAV
ncbi:MAG: sigma-70 family RNA polymerase sigma factor [Candidatus Omnitrophica bacterium]|nr:sigma-70 family RNA polymerase sigma factor [Candidatus Omnitrophota bacterium]